jgi:hypothetical protein
MTIVAVCNSSLTLPKLGQHWSKACWMVVMQRCIGFILCRSYFVPL